MGSCGRRLWTALRLEQAARTVARACEIEKRFPIVDQLARRREGLGRWAGEDRVEAFRIRMDFVRIEQLPGMAIKNSLLSLERRILAHHR